MALTSVYIGGRHFKRVNDRHEGAGPPLPLSELDATMDYLESLAYDFKDVLPPTRSLIEARGFQEVVMAGDARDIMNTEKGDNGGSSEMAVMNGGNRNARIVFHAPRGERLRHVGTSKCYNRFYDAAHQARMRNPRASSMEFEYRPTTEWYREQIEEGRDYDHISVDGWEPFFKTFKINLGDSH
ncbi:hypothetical protein Sste5346_001962 [Sporothrix stenoceras]|uniref:Uncharacterized protein n=1 Tax=Sporothrix stenoceras TaxID=5173 RepID=A0ABR3ZJS1_9PEZI